MSWSLDAAGATLPLSHLVRAVTEARPSPGGTIGLGRDGDWAGAGLRRRIAAGADRSWAASDSEPRRPPAEPASTFPGALPPPSCCPRGWAGRDAPRDPCPGRWPSPPSPLRRRDPPVTPQLWRTAHVPSRVPAHPQVCWEPRKGEMGGGRGASGRPRMRLARWARTPSPAAPSDCLKFKNKGCGSGSGPGTHLLTAAPSPNPAVLGPRSGVVG